MGQDEKGNYFIISEGRPYKVLLASITYFKAQPGDEVVIMIPREVDSSWAAIENVIQKGGHGFDAPEKENKSKISSDGEFNSWKNDFSDEDIPEKKKVSKEEIVDEWTSDIEALEKEIAAQG